MSNDAIDLPCYRVVSDEKEHHVIVVWPKTPDMWQRVASFVNRERAKSYAEIEQEWQDEEYITANPAGAYGEAPPPDPAAVPTLPLSAITSDNFRPPSAAEKARVGAALIEDAGRETGDTVVVKRKHAATVSPEELERRTEAALAAIRALTREGAKISYPTVAERCGIPAGSIAPAISVLRARGLITVIQPNRENNAELTRRGGIRLVEHIAAPPAAQPEVDPPANEPFIAPISRERLMAGR